MFRKTEELQVGDWIVSTSIFSSRFCGKPWTVDKISGSRVYVSCQFKDPTDIETKYIKRSQIVLAFTTEKEAIDASEKARLLSEEFNASMNEIKRKHDNSVKEYIDLVSGKDPQYAALNEIQQAYLRELDSVSRAQAAVYLKEKAEVFIYRQTEVGEVPEFAISMKDEPDFWIDCCESVEACKSRVAELGLTLVEKP